MKRNSVTFLLTIFVWSNTGLNAICAPQTAPPGEKTSEKKAGVTTSETTAKLNELWKGNWKDGTNGLRVRLYSERHGDGTWLNVGVGSVSVSSGAYVGPPSRGFLKFEIRDSSGTLVPFTRGKSLVGKLPARIAVDDLPRWSRYGGLKNLISILAGGGPFTLQDIKLDDPYRIREGGIYTLTVQPVIYHLGTNMQFVDRVDLPVVTTKVNLAPSQD